VALLAPIGAAAVLLARDLHARPSSRVPVFVRTVPTALTPGSEIVVSLNRTPHRYGSLVVTPEVDSSPAELELRICAAPDACTSFRGAVANGEPLRLPLPPEIRGGEIRVSTVEAVGSEVRIRTWPVGPAIEAVQGRSWALPFARARVFARAYTGRDLLPVALALHGLALGAVAVVIACAALPKRGDRARAAKE
jgi:hypothetical protein